MTEKTFKIISNSREFLTSEVIARALLNQISLSDEEPNVFFAVTEHERESSCACEEYLALNK